jgi:alpha-beta hydrolase superfamily lysophospholipase
MFTSRALRGVVAALLVWLCLGISPGRSAESTLKIPDPQNSSITTDDGLVLHYTFYPGGFQQNLKTKEVTAVPGKEVVPILLLHGWKGKRTEYDATASMLQRLGHAIMVPDLRGHGDSNVRRIPGREFTYNLDRMARGDIEMMRADLDAVKKVLLEKNNAEELNIELLCVVGAEFGATLAVNWAMADWSWPQLPGFKQGRDVKVLVLLSPLNSFRGISLDNALEFPVIRVSLPIMIVVGAEDTKNSRDAKAIYQRLAKFRGKTPANAKESGGRQNLVLVEPPTSLTGTQLLAPRGLTVNQQLAGFIHAQLTMRKGDFPWMDRRHRLVSP